MAGVILNAQGRFPATPGSPDGAAFLSGTVTLPDGSGPPAPVLIQQICDGQIMHAAWTDMSGRFSFMTGSRPDVGTEIDPSYSPVMPGYFDQSPHGAPGPSDSPIAPFARSCEVQAVLAGFRSDHVLVTSRASLDNNRLGTIVLHPLNKASSLTISATTLEAPPRARKAYEKGMADIKDRKWRPAAVEFNKAVTLYPKYAAAWYELGIALDRQSDPVDAIDAWKHSLASDLRFVSPYERLCESAYRMNNWNALDEYSTNWIRLNDEDFPAAYLFNAFAELKLNKMSHAESMAREGRRIDGQHKFPRLSFLLGFILLEERQYAESAKYLRVYLEEAPNASDAAAVREQIARLDQVAARTEPRP
jgi:hypothetical protein